MRGSRPWLGCRRPIGATGSMVTVHVRGTLERVVHVRTDVGVADVAMEVGARDEPCGLMARPAQDQTSAGLLHRGGEFFKRAQTGGVQPCHVAEPQDDDLRKTVHVIVDDPELIGGAEQKWSMNAEDLD